MSDVAHPAYPFREQALAVEFGQLPRVGVWESAVRYWPVVVLSTVALVIVGAALALARSPVYTAQARSQVGRLNLSIAGAVSGFSEAAQTLASSFSRAIGADGVVGPLARQFHTTTGEIRARLTATPVPSSSLRARRRITQ